MRKRLKDNHEVAHYWAHQRQEEGRALNFSFKGRTFYSYNTPIAVLVPVNGVELVLVADKSYSISTTEHRSQALNASSHIARHHYHTIMDYEQYLYPFMARSWAKDQYTDRIKKHTEAKDKLKRARCPYRKQQYRNYILHSAQWAADLLQLVNVFYELHETDPKAPELCSIDSDERQHRATLEAQLSGFQLERETEADYYAKLYADEANFENERYQHQLKEAEKAQINEAEQAADFHNFERDSVSWDCVHTYLRMYPETGNVRTSKGVQISAEHFIECYIAWKKGKALGLEIAGFKVTTIDSVNKLVKIGCHTITFSEIEATYKIVKDWRKQQKSVA